MKLDTEFCKLPLHFDVERLKYEVSQFAKEDWRPHPQGYPGNTAIALIAAGGDPANDAVKGPMRPTPLLQRCPYLQQVLGEFGCVLGRTRLMRIAGQGEATAHVDTNYYWLQRVRIHVPIVTFPEVRFLCGGREVCMAPGEAWLFDTWRRHNVLNPTPHDRIHLVADTVGSAAFWELVASAERPFAASPSPAAPTRFVSFDPALSPDLELETVNFPVVMSPWEQECLRASLLDHVDPSAGGIAELATRLRRFLWQWRALWARFGTEPRGWPAYRQALQQFDAALVPLEGRAQLANDMEAVEIIRQALVRPALNIDLAPAAAAVRPAPAEPRAAPPAPKKTRFDRPIFIVAAPRSGSTLLFETLARSPSVWTIGSESHHVFEGIPQLNPALRGFDSNRLTAADADPATAQALQESFLARLRDRDGRSLPPDVGALRLLEKTPKNCLRIPFLNAIFPDALFIYLFREPPDNLSSIMEAWRSGKFVTYPQLPGWGGPPWSLVLVPEWRELRGKEMAEIAAAQWTTAHRHILDDLAAIPEERRSGITYADLVADPQGQVRRLCEFAGIAWDEDLHSGELPHSRHTLTAPDPEKWKQNAAELEPVLPQVEASAERARAFVSTRQPVAATPLSPARDVPTSAPANGQPLRSSYTSNFPRLLERLGASLLVTTYQAGKLIIVRADDDQLNTHFRNFPMPMGLAGDHRRLALGTRLHVWQFRNQPEVGRKLEPVGKHDACFLPRTTHATGDIRIHEIAWAGDELWVVNTRFSCLCTLDPEHSFVPRWRPPFVSVLAAEDRCHLNGLAVIDDRPRHVTCLGATDTAGGWREHKANGGLLLDVDTGETLLSELSMPHSPRWHQEQLWLLESGQGSLARVNLERGQLETVVQLPGFTRGLDFCEHLAFIGLSQVRETAVFSGIPITERVQERTCGVWVVDTRTGKTVAFLRFEGAVQEIFAVQVLRGVHFPELITDDEETLANSFVIPDEALKDVAVAAVS